MERTEFARNSGVIFWGPTFLKLERIREAGMQVFDLDEAVETSLRDWTSCFDGGLAALKCWANAHGTSGAGAMRGRWMWLERRVSLKDIELWEAAEEGLFRRGKCSRAKVSA
jgi:hypothetical protein